MENVVLHIEESYENRFYTEQFQQPFTIITCHTVRHDPNRNSVTVSVMGFVVSYQMMKTVLHSAVPGTQRVPGTQVCCSLTGKHKNSFIVS